MKEFGLCWRDGFRGTFSAVREARKRHEHHGTTRLAGGPRLHLRNGEQPGLAGGPAEPWLTSVRRGPVGSSGGLPRPPPVLAVLCGAPPCAGGPAPPFSRMGCARGDETTSEVKLWEDLWGQRGAPSWSTCRLCGTGAAAFQSCPPSDPGDKALRETFGQQPARSRAPHSNSKDRPPADGHAAGFGEGGPSWSAGRSRSRG